MADTELPKREEFGFLDLIAIVSEWWKALVFIPIFIGILVYGTLRTVPTTYSAHAVLNVKPDQIVQLSWPAILDQVIRARTPGAKDDEAVAQIRQDLLDNLKILPLSQTTFYSIDLNGKNEKDITATLTAIIDQFVRHSVPSGNSKAVLESDIQFLEGKLQTLETGRKSEFELADRLSKSDSPNVPFAAITGPPPQIAYLNEISATRGTLAEKKIKLGGLNWDTTVVQKPALIVHRPTTKYLFVTAAMMGAFLVTLLIALALEILPVARVDSSAKKKLSRIRNALSLRKS
jgi:hypothetical protein